VDGSKPVMRETSHLYINLPAIRPKLEAWMKDAAERGRWSKNAIQMTNAWIRDGLKERSITRDLKWGIPVPLEEFKDKVIYVWFDAPIGYISITANHTDEWQKWWKDPETTELFQFIGKDNIPFHTVIFPCSLLASGDTWTMLHHMSSTEYLNYEAGKFSKSKGIGVFGNDAMDTGIPADIWRFYIYYNRPETSDYVFTWKDFQEKVNGELIGNLGNLVNRTLTFLTRYYDGKLAEGRREGSQEFWDEVKKLEGEITDHLEWANLRDAFRKVFALSSLGNRTFQATEPWRTRKEDPETTHQLLTDLVYLLRDLAILCKPYLPETADRIAGFLSVNELSWDALGELEGISAVGQPEILFEQIANETVSEMRDRFSGSQAERKAAEEARSKAGASGKSANAADAPGSEDPLAALPIEARFAHLVRLKAARITGVEQHPNADRLFVEQLDDGSGLERQIVSGLVGHYTAEQLEGKTIIVVDNLKPAKLRGVKSQGMLLAASRESEEGEIVDVLFLDDIEPGTIIEPELSGEYPSPDQKKKIDIDTFFSMPIRAEGGVVKVGDAPLIAAGKPVTTSSVTDGSVG